MDKWSYNWPGNKLSFWLQSENVIGSCVFWQIGLPQRTWLTRGCVRVEHESSARVTTCECDHLTVFAVLMNNKPVKKIYCVFSCNYENMSLSLITGLKKKYLYCSFFAAMTWLNRLALFRNSVNIIIYLFVINVVYYISFTIIPRRFFLGTSLCHNEAQTNGYRLWPCSSASWTPWADRRFLAKWPTQM